MAAALALTAAACGDGTTEPSVPPGRLVFRTVDGNNSGLAVAQSDGSGRAPLLIGQMGEPVWSPDGAQVAFRRWNEYGYSDIWVLRTSEGQQRQLTQTPLAEEREPACAPGGDRLAWTVAYGGVSGDERDSIVVANADGRGATAVARGSSAAWAPDGRLAFMDGSDVGSRLPTIWVLGTDRNRTRVSAPTSDRVIDAEPAWSSTSRLAWISRRIVLLPAGGRGPDSTSLMVQPAPGAQAVAILADMAFVGHPSWSPDASRLVVTGAWSGTWSGTWQLWIVPDRGGRRRRVTTTPAGCDDVYPCGNPNASRAR